jgi:hypothetical protein
MSLVKATRYAEDNRHISCHVTVPILFNFFRQPTPRAAWQDNGREDTIHSPPEKRPRSYSPSLSNHIDPKTDLQESLLGQALEGGPTIHTVPSNNAQVSKNTLCQNKRVDNLEWVNLELAHINARPSYLFPGTIDL